LRFHGVAGNDGVYQAVVEQKFGGLESGRQAGLTRLAAVKARQFKKSSNFCSTK